jgi:hypothetical protein
LRRAVNVFQYYVDLAVSRTRRAIDNEEEDDSLDAPIRDAELRRRWERAHNYAKELIEAYRGWQRDVEKEKKVGGFNDAQWAGARQVSSEHNLERYKVGPLSCSFWARC